MTFRVSLRAARAPLAALALLSAAVPAAAQERPSAERTVSAGVGAVALDLDALNGALASAGYPTFAETLPLFGLDYTWHFRGGPALGFGADGFVSPTRESADGDHELSMGGGWARVSVGWPIAAGARVRIVPSVGVGGGGMTVTIRETAEVSFGDVLDDPGRSVKLSTTAFQTEAALQADVRLGGRGARSGWLLGVRMGYAASPWTSGWSEVEGGDVSGGPDAEIRGPFARVTLGRWNGGPLR